MCWWSFFTSSVSLHSLSIHCHHQYITTLSFFPCRSSTGEKGELSLHPFTSHPFFSFPVVILSFSPSMFSTCGLTGLLGTLSLLFLTIVGLETFTGLLGNSTTETFLYIFSCHFFFIFFYILLLLLYFFIVCLHYFS